ncbi:retrovirus-related pol polyprotein from transposon TNT 1-94 [Tanacetum coccineum]
MSKVKCYNCKKECHFAKDCKKEKANDYNYYKTKMLLAKKDSDEQVLLAEDQAWMESSSDSDQELSVNMVFMAKMEKILSDLEESSASNKETLAKVSYYSSDSEMLKERNDDLLALTKRLEEQLKVKHVVINTHTKCQAQYAKLEEEKQQYVIKFSSLVDNDRKHRQKIDAQEILYNKMSCFENPSYFCKAKELRPSLYDERVIGLGYTPMFLTHSDEALEIEKFKRARENKIEFAYDYGNLNESYVNEKINFSDDYFQEIINPDFEKIDSPFQQTSSLKPYVPTVILEKIIIDLEDEVVSLLKKEKENLEIIESLKSKGLESSENAISESENQSENDCQLVKKGCDNLENSNVAQTVSPISMSKTLHASYDVNDLFVFDDVSIRNSRVSKMPFRKKPRDSLNVRSKSNSNNSLPRTLFRWLPKMQPLAEPVAKWIPKIVQICLWIIDSGCSKHMTGNRALLTNFVEKFLGTVRFGNNDFAVIAGYGDVVIGSMTIKKVYYVEGLGHNLFSVGQFCDKGLEVAFRKSTCFVRTEDGVDLLTGDRSSNLYTIALNEIVSNSSACLLAKASSSQSWLWHQRLSHLNFATINNLVKNNLVRGLPKMKFEKDHLCSACEQGKIHRKHHKSKTAFASNKPLYLLHMDLCGPMCVENEASEVIISFIKKTQVNLQLQVQRVRTDNGTEFKNKKSAKFFVRCYLLNDYDDVGKLKAKGDIRVFVGYSKESAAFRVYNKRTRKIHESVNVNFDEISEMASKQFRLEPEESSSSSLNDDVQQSLEEVMVPPTNTQSVSNNMVPSVNKASSTHNVFDERLEDAYFDASTSLHDTSNVHTFYQPYPHEKKWTKSHPLHKIIGDPKSSVRTRGQLANSCAMARRGGLINCKMKVWRLVSDPKARLSLKPNGSSRIRKMKAVWLFETKQSLSLKDTVNKKALIMMRRLLQLLELS